MKIMDFRRKIHHPGENDADFQPYKRDEPLGGPSYYLLMNVVGGFVIIRETVTDDVTVTDFYYGKGGVTSADTAWEARVSLSAQYVPIYTLLS